MQTMTRARKTNENKITCRLWKAIPSSEAESIKTAFFVNYIIIVLKSPHKNGQDHYFSIQYFSKLFSASIYANQNLLILYMHQSIVLSQIK